jgi:hypothetical protein
MSQTQMRTPTRVPPSLPVFDEPDLPLAAVWTIDELDHSADLESVRSAWANSDAFRE